MLVLFELLFSLGLRVRCGYDGCVADGGDLNLVRDGFAARDAIGMRRVERAVFVKGERWRRAVHSPTTACHHSAGHHLCSVCTFARRGQEPRALFDFGVGLAAAASICLRGVTSLGG